eukprot:CAMPEP_0194124942 /NCGR_PEP_ID=MMETSP0150-20130528/59201_1 /TAXON_ID=122233 /ORGANISM="Chaetoceros debilis, Strain MM31A-1" /LENGTH=2931 /DNA_ID=CAMNT_0038818727 /DNA_START=94 /DNA_END=8886 /DNA_ORIENTATION=-
MTGAKFFTAAFWIACTTALLHAIDAHTFPNNLHETDFGIFVKNVTYNKEYEIDVLDLSEAGKVGDSQMARPKQNSEHKNLVHFIEKWDKGRSYENNGEQHVVNYGGQHPFEIMQRRRLRESEGYIFSDDEEKSYRHFHQRHLTPWLPNSEYQSLRIHVDTAFMDLIDDEQFQEEISVLINDILPRVKAQWEQILKVYRARGPIIVNDAQCPHSSNEHVTNGIEDADLVLFMAANIDLICEEGGALAAARSCQADQYDRPIVGSVVVCLNRLDVNDQKSKDKFYGVLLHELTHVFGMRAIDFPYFHDPTTGLPRTPRPFQSKTVTCVDGNMVRTVAPSDSTLKAGFTKRGKLFYEVVTPTVRQVVRNHFDCQKMSGARLENQPTNDGNCFGSHWESRLFASDIVAAIKLPTHQILTPLTLAILEDSGWYKADYTSSSVSPFGHGRGCDFVYEDCIVNSEVPEWGKGFFCNDLYTDQSSMRCDSSHKYITRCDLVDYNDYPLAVPPGRNDQYFPSHPTWGGLLHVADYCPMNNMIVTGTNADKIFDFQCEDDTLQSNVDAEFFGDSSRCIETNMIRPLCMKTLCDPQKKKVVVYTNIGGTSTPIVCENDGDFLDIPGIADAKLQCPVLQIACPEFACPSNCRGRGLCDFSLADPVCLCCDPNDASEDCRFSDPCDLEDTSNGSLFCGKSFGDASSCRDNSECPGGLDSDCNDGEYCFSVLSCDDTITGGENYYCGTTLSNASSCSSPCPSGSSRDCPFDQQCFGTSSCNLEEDSSNDDDEVDLVDSNNFCGSSYQEALQCGSTSCPSGTNSECPLGESCFTVDGECTIDDDDDGNNYCGKTFQDAATCEDTKCPSGTNGECPIGSSCFTIESCIVPRDDILGSNTFCGITLDSASQCSTSCPSFSNDECPAGEACFSVDTCIEPLSDPDSMFCGSSLLNAAQCSDSSKCPSGLDSECPANQECFKVDNCIDPDTMHCGANLAFASQCSTTCPSGLDSECTDGEQCFSVQNCDMYCSSDLAGASECSFSCPSGIDSECPIGQNCYGVQNCNKFCGSSLSTAAQCSLSCPSGLDSECPAGEQCFGVEVCNKFCGESPFDAAGCEESCTSGLDSECSSTKKCYAVDTCKDDQYYADPNGDGKSFFCESSDNPDLCRAPGYLCANEPGGGCGSGQYCFYEPPCNDNEVIGNYFCGSSLPIATECTQPCPSGLNSECPYGQQCYNVNTCKEEQGQPTPSPTARPRLSVEVVFTFCLEHGILTPVYKLLRNTDKAINSLLTDKFLDDVVEIDKRWSVDEKHLEVESVNTAWLQDSPNLECVCQKGDAQSSCTAVESTARVSFWEELDPDMIRFVLLAYQKHVTDNMKYPATYWGFISFETQNSVQLYGTPSPQMSEDSQQTFEDIVKDYLNEDLQSYKVPGLEVLVVDIDSISSISDARSLRSNKNSRRLEDLGVAVEATITGQFVPPPDVDIGNLIDESLERGSDDITNELKNSGDPYFKDISPIGVDDENGGGGNVGGKGGTDDKRKESKVGLILGLLFLLLFLAALVVIAIIFYRRRQEKEIDDRRDMDDGTFATNDYGDFYGKDGSTYVGSQTKRGDEYASIITDPTYRGGQYDENTLEKDKPTDYYEDEDAAEDDGTFTGQSIVPDSHADDISALMSVRGVEDGWTTESSKKSVRDGGWTTESTREDNLASVQESSRSDFSGTDGYTSQSQSTYDGYSSQGKTDGYTSQSQSTFGEYTDQSSYRSSEGQETATDGYTSQSHSATDDYSVSPSEFDESVALMSIASAPTQMRDENTVFSYGARTNLSAPTIFEDDHGDSMSESARSTPHAFDQMNDQGQSNHLQNSSSGSVPDTYGSYSPKSPSDNFDSHSLPDYYQDDETAASASGPVPGDDALTTISDTRSYRSAPIVIGNANITKATNDDVSVASYASAPTILAERRENKLKQPSGASSVRDMGTFSLMKIEEEEDESSNVLESASQARASNSAAIQPQDGVQSQGSDDLLSRNISDRPFGINYNESYLDQNMNANPSLSGEETKSFLDGFDPSGQSVPIEQGYDGVRNLTTAAGYDPHSQSNLSQDQSLLDGYDSQGNQSHTQIALDGYDDNISLLDQSLIDGYDSRAQTALDGNGGSQRSMLDGYESQGQQSRAQSALGGHGGSQRSMLDGYESQGQQSRAESALGGYDDNQSQFDQSLLEGYESQGQQSRAETALDGYNDNQDNQSQFDQSLLEGYASQGHQSRAETALDGYDDNHDNQSRAETALDGYDDNQDNQSQYDQSLLEGYESQGHQSRADTALDGYDDNQSHQDQSLLKGYESQGHRSRAETALDGYDDNQSHQDQSLLGEYESKGHQSRAENALDSYNDKQNQQDDNQDQSLLGGYETQGHQSHAENALDGYDATHNQQDQSLLGGYESKGHQSHADTALEGYNDNHNQQDQPQLGGYESKGHQSRTESALDGYDDNQSNKDQSLLGGYESKGHQSRAETALDGYDDNQSHQDQSLQGGYETNGNQIGAETVLDCYDDSQNHQDRSLLGGYESKGHQIGAETALDGYDSNQKSHSNQDQALLEGYESQGHKSCAESALDDYHEIDKNQDKALPDEDDSKSRAEISFVGYTDNQDNQSHQDNSLHRYNASQAIQSHIEPDFDGYMNNEDNQRQQDDDSLPKENASQGHQSQGAFDDGYAHNQSQPDNSLPRENVSQGQQGRVASDFDGYADNQILQDNPQLGGYESKGHQSRAESAFDGYADNEDNQSQFDQSILEGYESQGHQRRVDDTIDDYNGNQGNQSSQNQSIVDDYNSPQQGRVDTAIDGYGDNQSQQDQSLTYGSDPQDHQSLAETAKDGYLDSQDNLSHHDQSLNDGGSRIHEDEDSLLDAHNAQGRQQSNSVVSNQSGDDLQSQFSYGFDGYTRGYDSRCDSVAIEDVSQADYESLDPSKYVD